MRRTIFIKGLSVISFSLVFIFSSSYGQCYGPTSTGNYTSGKQPSANSNYFINHVFSTFTTTILGSLNGNAIVIATTGSPTTNDITSSLTPAETLVTGTGFPSAIPAMHRVSPNSTSVKVTHLFTS